jgi:hypothetical protein
MGNPFSVNVLGGVNLGDELTKAVEGRRRLTREDEAKQEKLNLQGAIKGAVGGDPDSIETLYTLNPQYAQMFEKRNDQKSQKLGAENAALSKEAETSWGLKWSQSTTPEQFAALEQEALNNPLIDFDEDDLGVDKNHSNLAVNSMLFQNLGKDAYKQFYNQGGSKSGLPAEAVAFNDLIKDFTPEQQITAKKIKVGLKGRAMSNALLTSIENGSVSNLKDAKAEIKQAEKFAEMTGTSRAKTIDRGFDRIVKIDSGIKNIDRAIAAVDGGAGVGAVEKLWPSIKASSVELDNIRGQMALDVVGATTFGALSKGELDLAKDIALPTGLDTAQLKDYLSKKKSAQQKLRNYFNEQIQFLDQGGTVAGFLRSKETKAVNWSDM